MLQTRIPVHKLLSEPSTSSIATMELRKIVGATLAVTLGIVAIIVLFKIFLSRRNAAKPRQGAFPVPDLPEK